MNTNPELDKMKEPVKYAHDIRKFEIDLLWKRSAFIWTLITAVLSGVLLMLTNNNPLNNKYHIDLLLSLLGLILSICWYYLNRGSKYWQEKWEAVIMANEDAVTGPMYKSSSLYQIESKFWKLNSAYGFSPSKILINVSLFFVLIWIFLISIQMYSIVIFIDTDVLKYISSISISLLITIFVFFLLYKSSINRIEKD